MKISGEKEAAALGKQAESHRRRQPEQRSGEQLEDARAKFSSTLKKAKTGEVRTKAGPGKKTDENPFDRPFDSAGSRRSGGQLEDARAKFSSTLKEPKTGTLKEPKTGTLKEPKTGEVRAEARPDKKTDENPFDSAENRRADVVNGVIANADNIRAETPAVAKADQPAPVAHNINLIAQKVAERILVSPPGAGNPEVRIQLKESVLQGSDVRIFREGGALKVVFVAPSQDAANFIAGNRDAMTVALKDRLPGEQIDISVETRQSEHEHGEGRSRQQYVADNDADADAPGMKR